MEKNFRTQSSNNGYQPEVTWEGGEQQERRGKFTFLFCIVYCKHFKLFLGESFSIFLSTFFAGPPHFPGNCNTLFQGMLSKTKLYSKMGWTSEEIVSYLEAVMKKSALCLPFKHLTFVLRQAGNRKLLLELSSWFKACLGEEPGKQVRINRHFVSNRANTDGASQVEWLLLVYREPISVFHSPCTQPSYWARLLVFQACQLILLVILGRLYALQRVYAKSVSFDFPFKIFIPFFTPSYSIGQGLQLNV